MVDGGVKRIAPLHHKVGLAQLGRRDEPLSCFQEFCHHPDFLVLHAVEMCIVRLVLRRSLPWLWLSWEASSASESAWGKREMKYNTGRALAGLLVYDLHS